MPTFDLAELSQNVLDGLDNNTGLFPQGNITAVINQSLFRLGLLTGFNQATVPVPGFTQQNVLLYQTPPGIIIPLRLEIEAQEIDPVSFRRLAQEFQFWYSDNTAANGPTARWARLGFSQFIIHPQDSVGGLLMEITGIAPITPLVNPGDTITLDQQFADILIEYSIIRLFLKETGTPFSSMLKRLPELKRKIWAMSIWRAMGYPAQWIDQQMNPTGPKGLL